MAEEKCFACGKAIRCSAGSEPATADTRDGQFVYVGPECWREIERAGEQGYQPPKGGPKLWAFYHAI